MSRNCNCANCVACTCSKHRCDVRHAERSRQHRQPLHYTPDQLTSVSAATYKPPTREDLIAASKVAQKPDWAQIHSPNAERPRFDGRTTTGQTYQGAQNPRPASASGRPFFDRFPDSADGGPRRTLPFEAKSAYTEQYPPRDIRQAQPNVHIDADRHLQAHFSIADPKAKFDGNTTNSREYREWDLPRPQTAAGSQSATNRRPALKFEGESQTHADFRPKQRDPSQPLGHRYPEAQAYIPPPHLHFDAKSTTQDTYRGKQLPPSHREPAAAPTQRPSLPFQGESQTHSDFKRYDPNVYAHPADRNGSDVFRSHFRTPAEVYGSSGNKGRYDTEHRTQYEPKSIPPCPVQYWSSPIPTPSECNTPHNY